MSDQATTTTKPSTWGITPDENTPAGTKIRNIHTEMVGTMTTPPTMHGTLGWDAFGAETFGETDSFRIWDPAYHADDPAPAYTGRTLRVLIKKDGAVGLLGWGLTPEQADEVIDQDHGDDVRVWAEDDPGQVPADTGYPVGDHPLVKPYAHRIAAPQMLWDSYMGVEPEATAEMFTRAAELVRTQGHNAYGNDDPNPGISISQALRAVAHARLDAEQFGYVGPHHVDELVDELENRLAGVLYLLGQAQGKPMNAMSGVPFTWEHGTAEHFPNAYHGQADIVRLLTLAAAMAELVGATWPPTA